MTPRRRSSSRSDGTRPVDWGAQQRVRQHRTAAAVVGWATLSVLAAAVAVGRLSDFLHRAVEGERLSRDLAVGAQILAMDALDVAGGAARMPQEPRNGSGAGDHGAGPLAGFHVDNYTQARCEGCPTPEGEWCTRSCWGAV